MTDLPNIPARMQRRPRDARGFPIPWAQFITADGTPDFRILDAVKVETCLRWRRCGLCGEPMGRHVFFVGGPSCVTHGIFCDPPMHRECAAFSLQVCAHLNRSKGRYNFGPLPHTPGVEFSESAVMSTVKAEWFALMHATEYTYGRAPDGMTMIRAVLPWLDVERWRDGAPEEQTHAHQGQARR